MYQLASQEHFAFDDEVPAWLQASLAMGSPPANRSSGSILPRDNLPQGTWISEASLWTTWEHRGELNVGLTIASVLIVAEAEFGISLKHHPRVHAATKIYAKKFVESLNRDPCNYSDTHMPSISTQHLFISEKDVVPKLSTRNPEGLRAVNFDFLRG